MKIRRALSVSDTACVANPLFRTPRNAVCLCASSEVNSSSGRSEIRVSTALQGNSAPSGEKSPCLPPLASREPVRCRHRALRENVPTSPGSSDHSPQQPFAPRCGPKPGSYPTTRCSQPAAPQRPHRVPRGGTGDSGVSPARLQRGRQGGSRAGRTQLSPSDAATPLGPDQPSHRSLGFCSKSGSFLPFLSETQTPR